MKKMILLVGILMMLPIVLAAKTEIFVTGVVRNGTDNSLIDSTQDIYINFTNTTTGNLIYSQTQSGIHIDEGIYHATFTSIVNPWWFLYDLNFTMKIGTDVFQSKQVVPALVAHSAYVANDSRYLNGVLGSTYQLAATTYTSTNHSSETHDYTKNSTIYIPEAQITDLKHVSNCNGTNCDIGWGNLTDIPADIADGDDVGSAGDLDNLDMLNQTIGNARYVYQSWDNVTYSYNLNDFLNTSWSNVTYDSELAYPSNCNGTNCDIGWGNLTDVPADIADGDDNTQLSDADILALGYNHTTDIKTWVDLNDDVGTAGDLTDLDMLNQTIGNARYVYQSWTNVTYDNEKLGNTTAEIQAQITEVFLNTIGFNTTAKIKTYFDTLFVPIGGVVNTTTQFGGEVTGTYDAIVLGHDALDDQYIELGDSFGGNVTGTYGALYVNPCGVGEVLKYSANGWICAVDAGTTYTGGANISISGGVISINKTFAEGSSDLSGLDMLNQTIGNARYVYQSWTNVTYSSNLNDFLNTSWSNVTYDSEWNTQGEVETIWGTTLATDTELGSYTLGVAAWKKGNSTATGFWNTANFTTSNTSEWADAYAWGDHSTIGYGLGSSLPNITMLQINDTFGNFSQWLGTYPNVDTDSTDDLDIAKLDNNTIVRTHNITEFDTVVSDDYDIDNFTTNFASKKVGNTTTEIREQFSSSSNITYTNGVPTVTLSCVDFTGSADLCDGSDDTSSFNPSTIDYVNNSGTYKTANFTTDFASQKVGNNTNEIREQFTGGSNITITNGVISINRTFDPSAGDFSGLEIINITNLDNNTIVRNHNTTWKVDSLGELQSTVTNDFHNLGGTDLTNSTEDILDVISQLVLLNATQTNDSIDTKIAGAYTTTNLTADTTGWDKVVSDDYGITNFTSQYYAISDRFQNLNFTSLYYGITSRWGIGNFTSAYFSQTDRYVKANLTIDYPDLDIDSTDDLDIVKLDNNTIVRNHNTTWVFQTIGSLNLANGSYVNDTLKAKNGTYNAGYLNGEDASYYQIESSAFKPLNFTTLYYTITDRFNNLNFTTLTSGWDTIVSDDYGIANFTSHYDARDYWDAINNSVDIQNNTEFNASRLYNDQQIMMYNGTSRGCISMNTTHITIGQC